MLATPLLGLQTNLACLTLALSPVKDLLGDKLCHFTGNYRTQDVLLKLLHDPASVTLGDLEREFDATWNKNETPAGLIYLRGGLLFEAWGGNKTLKIYQEALMAEAQTGDNEGDNGSNAGVGRAGGVSITSSGHSPPVLGAEVVYIGGKKKKTDGIYESLLEVQNRTICS